MMRILAAAAAAAVALSACGSSGGSSAETDAGNSGAGNSGAVDASAAICAKDAAAKTVGLPASFPGDFPMPPGTKIYSVSDRGSSGIVVTGVTSAPFKSVLSALQTELPAKGFRPDNGETEPRDAESDWESSDFKGRWAIRELPQCSGDTLVNVVARKST
jgi:hypothetical protein